MFRLVRSGAFSSITKYSYKLRQYCKREKSGIKITSTFLRGKNSPSISNTTFISTLSI